MYADTDICDRPISTDPYISQALPLSVWVSQHLDPHAPAFVCLDWDYITQSASCGRVRAAVGASYILSLTHVPLARWVSHGVKLVGCVGFFFRPASSWCCSEIRFTFCAGPVAVRAPAQQKYSRPLSCACLLEAYLSNATNFSFSCCCLYSHLNFILITLYLMCLPAYSTCLTMLLSRAYIFKLMKTHSSQRD